MANQTIRVPKQGRTAMSRRIAQAVDDQAWQEFRLSMKGRKTAEKLEMLKAYFETRAHTETTPDKMLVECDVCIRLHNYLTALARGGQLYEGVSLARALEQNWLLEIKRG